MLASTLELLRCPTCRASFRASSSEEEIRSGALSCVKCKREYPVLGGVAVLVRDVRGYLLQHVKGIGRHVSIDEIPRAIRKEFKAAQSELEAEHIEEDLEAERVVALYLANHYLQARDSWWKARAGGSSELIDRLIREHWDQGPLQKIASWLARLNGPFSLIELGCGVGGLAPRLGPGASSYLGVDSSFSSVALARHFCLGTPIGAKLGIPEDLLFGSVSRSWPGAAQIPIRKAESRDFVVGDLEAFPVERGQFDVAVVLNAIDMLPKPRILPELQHALLKPDGLAIQSCPYIWHEQVSKQLRGQIPKGILDSARAVEWLYDQAGFEREDAIEHLPWLFFKHPRQLELYSVHLFSARKRA